MRFVGRIRLYSTEGIVLKRRDFGEADRILTIYTLHLGKVHAVAKGVRRIASRKSGHLELFTHSRLMLAEGRNLYVLTQADTLHAYSAIRQGLIRTTYAYHIVELVDRFVQEGAESAEAFGLLRDCLQALGEAEDPALLARYFEIRLLGLLGYQPELFRCVACARVVGQEGNVFSPEAGGVLCPQCGSQAQDGLGLTAAGFRVLRFLQTRDWAVARNVQLTLDTRRDLERWLHAYLRHILERDLRSVEFLNRLRRFGVESDHAPSPPGPDRRRPPVS